MTSAEAHQILTEHFPKSPIVEIEGNPNVLGRFAFLVNGMICWVDGLGEVIMSEALAHYYSQKPAAI